MATEPVLNLRCPTCNCSSVLREADRDVCFLCGWEQANHRPGSDIAELGKSIAAGRKVTE